MAAEEPHSPRGLPLAPLLSPVPHVSSLFCVVTPMDDRGRLADRSPIRAAGWSPGQPVTISITRDHIAIVGDGPHAITDHGHIRLPSYVRHACRLVPGDRLLVAVPAPGVLAVYPMAALEAILSRSGAFDE